MANHTIYRVDTGEILQNGWGMPFLPPGTDYILGQFDGATHYVDAERQPQLLPERPGPWARWTREGWIDPRTDADRAKDLVQARLSAVAAINAAAAEVRRRYVTDIPGQEALYMMKEAEARAWVASVDPDPAQFPLLAAEIGITAPTGDEVAQIYFNLAGLYVAAAARLETARLGHIALAEAAPDATSAEAAARAFAAVLQQGG